MAIDDEIEFRRKRQTAIREQAADGELRDATTNWMRKTFPHGYTYNFEWMGRPIIQFPQDIVALQEIIWKTQPDVIVETGVARGGSTIFFASMLAMLGGPRHVVSVDIDIRAHNRTAIEAHMMARYIHLIEGSSIETSVVDRVKADVGSARSVLLVLDSNHTHDHVLSELRAYAPLVKKGGYIVVFDTAIEDDPPNFFPNRPWGRGNSPRSALRQYLAEVPRFEVDESIDGKLLITVAPGGYLRCIADPADPTSS